MITQRMVCIDHQVAKQHGIDAAIVLDVIRQIIDRSERILRKRRTEDYEWRDGRPWLGTNTKYIAGQVFMRPHYAKKSISKLIDAGILEDDNFGGGASHPFWITFTKTFIAERPDFFVQDPPVEAPQ